MGEGRPDLEKANTWIRYAVPNELHFQDIIPSLMECICLGPQEQHVTLHDTWVILWNQTEGASALPLVAHADPYMSIQGSVKRGLNFH